MDVSAVTLLLESSSLAVAFPFAAVASAVLPDLVGGIVGNNASKKANKRAITQQRIADQRARYYQLRDRQNERRYAERLTASDRAYSEARLSDERRYAQRQTYDDRVYANAVRDREIKYLEGDRARQQALSDRQAERQAASRGIDFQRVRDDAIAAGFNPLTAMAYAGSYSTEVGYGVEGLGMSGSSMPASTPASPGVIPGSHAAPATSFQSPGGGFASYPQPAFETGAMAANLVGRGLDAYFSAVEERDIETYQSIERQVASGQLARLLSSQNPYQEYGFSRPPAKRFQPAVSVSAGSGAFDPRSTYSTYFDKPIDQQPVTEDPSWKRVNIGHGRTAWTMNPDVYEGEVWENVGGAITAAQEGFWGVYDGTREYASAMRRETSAQRAVRAVREGSAAIMDRAFPPGQRTFGATGGRPVAPVFRFEPSGVYP